MLQGGNHNSEDCLETCIIDVYYSFVSLMPHTEIIYVRNVGCTRSQCAVRKYICM